MLSIASPELAAAEIQVSVHPRAVAVRINLTVQFSATVKGIGNQSVKWSVDGIAGGNASVGSISVGGLYTAPAASGKHRITAKSVGHPGAVSAVVAFVTDYAGTFTYHNDNARTGQNLDEIALSPATVNRQRFGKLFADSVDGYVNAQPLYVPDVNIAGMGEHDVVYVATQHDSAYALDADASMAPLWQVSFIDPADGITTVPSADTHSIGIVPEIGITGTPVIDPASGTLYVVARTKENGAYAQRLHALDIGTGAEKFGGPVLIQASAPGSAAPNDGNGNVLWDPLVHNQRAALLFSRGVVYIGFASHDDLGPYHGWVLGYDAATLEQVAAYNDTPNGTKGGIWQTAGGPAADSDGNIFVQTGNGTFDGDSGGDDFGDSVLKLEPVADAFTPNSALSLADWYTPYNQQFFADHDLDLGSGGPMILPDQTKGPPHLLAGGDKQGNLYIWNRDDLGHFTPDQHKQAVQYLPNVIGPVFGTPAYWRGLVYFWGAGDRLRAYKLRNGHLSRPPASIGPRNLGGISSPTVSANGATGGIVWLLEFFIPPGGTTPQVPAVLDAFDAADVSRQLYRSSNSPRDAAGLGVKFTVPTVADGKVYVGGQYQLTVYGLLP
jgi:hypothetical protein